MALHITRKAGEKVVLDFGGAKAVITVYRDEGRGLMFSIDAPPSVVVTRPDMKVKESQDGRHDR